MSERARRSTVVRRRELSPRVSELELEVAGSPPFRWRAGQHVGLIVSESAVPHEGPLWYSIASAADARTPPVLTLAVGPGTGGDLLSGVGPGAELDVVGPLGSFSLPEAPGALLVGAGTGIAPLRAFVEEWLARPSAAPVTLVAGARTLVDLLWHDELTALAARDARLRYEPVLSQPEPPWSGRRGYVQQHLAELVPTLPPGLVVRACGSEAMVAGVLSVLTELGLPSDRVDAQSYS